MEEGLNLDKSKKESLDKRNYSFSKVFGTADLSFIPSDFTVGEPLQIKNQLNTDFCPAYMSTSLSELQEGVLLSPEFQFAKIKELEGTYYTWGASLQDAFKSLVKWGSLPAEDSPYKVGQNTRDEIANWENWNDMFLLENLAKKHLKQAYFKVDGYGNVFDAIRATMWLNRTEKRGVGTGCTWRTSWNHCQNGIIPVNYENGGIGHAFLFIGQKTIDGQPYLIAQNSIGPLGDNGFYYFSRKVVNREFLYGAYTVKDMLQESAQKVCWTPYQKLIKKLRNIFKIIL